MAVSRFALNVRKWSKATGQSLEQTVRSVEIEIFSRIIQRSPVKTGRFRMNWFLDRRETTDATDISGEVAIQRMTAEVMASQVGGITSFINTLPYAERLEFGHSKQAPEGMVRLTALEFGAVVSDAAAESRV